jgi:hypothetical protein
MSDAIKKLHQWIDDIAEALIDNTHFEITHFSFLEHDISLLASLLDRLEAQPQEIGDNEQDYSACLFAFDICIIQLQAAIENGYHPAEQRLQQLMTLMADKLNHSKHSINFWLPLLNAFYEVHIELSDELKDAYVELASVESPGDADSDVDQLQLIREMILELSDLSVFDITQHFFAQSHAMPAEFYYDLLYDLFAIDEGHDIAILCLMHPKADVRAVVMETIDQVIDSLALSPESLMRLTVIQHWFPASVQPIFERWIKAQRRQGVMYQPNQHKPKQVKLKASEIDGSGTQVIYISFKEGKMHHACSVMLYYGEGIKDIWFTSSLDASVDIDDIPDSQGLIMRTVDKDYLQRILNHFLFQTIALGRMPDIRLMQLQEHLGLNVQPQLLDLDAILDEFGVSIQPVTQDVIETSLKSSKHWPYNKAFTEAWYVQDARIDATVNRCCRFEQGVKMCDKILAKQQVIDDIFEKQRDRWLFHFIWHMLWLAAHAKKNERAWQDCFFIAYEIAQGRRLAEIPIMVAIADETIENSLETMEERGTYLTRLR